MKDFTLKVKTPVRSEDPYNKGVNVTSFYVELKDLAPGLPVDTVNTRLQNVNQSIYKKMIDGAIKDPKSFHLNNSGILIFARKCESIGKDKIKLTFSNFDGVGDGGHTYRSIQLANSTTGGVKGGFVRVQVISGLNCSNQKKVCLARNTSAANTESTIFNHNGDYDLLKVKFSTVPYYKDIGFRQNDKKPLDIRFLISLLSIFVLKNENVRSSYFNKSKVLRNYVKNKELFSAVLDQSDRIFQLYDMFKVEFSELHGKLKNKKAEEFFSEKKKGLFLLKFSKRSVKYNTQDKVIFAALASVRGLLLNPRESDESIVKAVAKKIYISICG